MKDARRCSSPAIRVEHALFLVLWTLLVTLATLAWQSKQFGAAAATVGGLIVAVIGGLWAHRMSLVPAASPEVPASTWRYLGGLTVLAASAGTVGIFLPAFMGLMAQLAAYKTFSQQQQAFETDPEGLPWIRKFAKREFNADVVMASSQDSWSRTALQLIGSSPAFMSTGNALCELSISRESILSTFPIQQGLDPNLWVHGIMMHELSHCLDVRRDFQGSAGSWTNTLSIAPVDRKGIGDGPSYYDVAAKRISTQLWREAVADAMAIGYWRLNANPDNAHAFIATLKKKRAQSYQDDPAHATMCWIDSASAAAPPGSNHELFAWADRLRLTSPCSRVKP
jgi:hypothetical protein